MNILIVTHEYPPIGGGGANACMFLAKQYAEMGHSVTIITSWYEGLPDHENLYDNKVNIFRVRAKRRHLEHCGFDEMFDYLVKAIKLSSVTVKKERYDICQVFFGIPSGPIGLYLKKKYDIPYVIRFGGGDIPGFQNRFKILYKIIGMPLKIIWKNADALVANSKGLKEFALDFYSKCDIEIIHNGVDPEKYTTSNIKNKSDKVELLFVSRLIARKGLQNLIPYLAKIQDETLKEIHLTVVGDGPYRMELEKIASDADVLKLIDFVGQKEKSELPAFYQSGDVFVFPSTKEGMPNAVLEAMASGLPIIMMDCCEGSEELVDTNGILANEEFYKAVNQFLLLDDEQKKHMAERSREKAVDEFSWNSVAQQYLSLFESIIK